MYNVFVEFTDQTYPKQKKNPSLFILGKTFFAPEQILKPKLQIILTNKFNLIKTTISGRYQLDSTNTFMTSQSKMVIKVVHI